MRAVLDANVLVSALIAPRGVPAKSVIGWEDGAFDIVVSDLLLAELERVFTYPRLAELVDAEDASELLERLRVDAEVVADPAVVSIRCSDPDDEYLIALAAQERVPLVSGDNHLLALSEQIPVFTPLQFLDLLDSDQPVG